jgi:hypothetical protein
VEGACRVGGEAHVTSEGDFRVRLFLKLNSVQRARMLCGAAVYPSMSIRYLRQWFVQEADCNIHILTGIFNDFLLILYAWRRRQWKATRSLVVTMTSWSHTDVRCPSADVDNPPKSFVYVSRRLRVHVTFTHSILSVCITAAKGNCESVCRMNGECFSLICFQKLLHFSSLFLNQFTSIISVQMCFYILKNPKIGNGKMFFRHLSSCHWRVLPFVYWLLHRYFSYLFMFVTFRAFSE